MNGQDLGLKKGRKRTKEA